jgi:hypothetical protein
VVATAADLAALRFFTPRAGSMWKVDADLYQHPAARSVANPLQLRRVAEAIAAHESGILGGRVAVIQDGTADRHDPNNILEIVVREPTTDKVPGAHIGGPWRYSRADTELIHIHAARDPSPTKGLLTFRYDCGKYLKWLKQWRRLS